MPNITYIEDMQKWSQSFSFYHPVTVRFSETDAFGHLNNTVTFVYFEEARIEFFKSIGLMQDWMQPGSDRVPVTADLHCDYTRQVYFDEQLNVYVKVNHIGNSSIDIHYMAKNQSGDVCFTGRGRIVQISKGNGKAVEWTDEVRNKLSHSLHATN